MKKVYRAVAVLFALVLVVKFSPYSYLIRGIQGSYLDGYKSAHLYDRNHFDQREIPALRPAPLPEAQSKLALDPTIAEQLAEIGTAGIVAVHNDSIVFEEYYNAHGPTVISNSFSSAKTVITLLTQIAIQDGYIGSWDDPITNYVAEFEVPEGHVIPTLRHFSTMTSGMQTSESYKNPLSNTAKIYYGDDVVAATLETPSGKTAPGEVFEYLSASTQVLTIALSRAVGESISSYANRELFAKVGFETTATWHLDQKGGLELGFCCLNASTRDFAKLGQFVLHHGNVDGHAVVDSTFLHQATTGFKSPFYGHSFWIYPAPYDHIFGFRGKDGQNIFIDPQHNLVVTRTGESAGQHWQDGYRDIEHLILQQMALWSN